jgi:hypothetical protein
MKWLTDKGIDKKRLVAQGFGQEQPIDSNESDAGRANNRRVAFTILERDGADAAAKPPAEAKPGQTQAPAAKPGATPTPAPAPVPKPAPAPAPKP